MQCLLGCTGVSPAQHNYSLFWCVLLSSTMFWLHAVVFCYIHSVLALLFYPLCVSCSALFCSLTTDFPLLHFIIFFELAPAESLNDLLQQNISISSTFVVSCLLLWYLKSLLWLLQWIYLFIYSICLPCCWTRSLLSSISELLPLAWSLWLTASVSMGLWDASNLVVYPACLTILCGSQMFPESCKYLRHDLMSADIISDHKDIFWLPICVYSSCEDILFPARKPLRLSEGPNENITQEFDFSVMVQTFSLTSQYAADCIVTRHPFLSFCLVTAGKICQRIHFIEGWINDLTIG